MKKVIGFYAVMAHPPLPIAPYDEFPEEQNTNITDPTPALRLGDFYLMTGADLPYCEEACAEDGFFTVVSLKEPEVFGAGVLRKSSYCGEHLFIFLRDAVTTSDQLIYAGLFSRARMAQLVRKNKATPLAASLPSPK